MKKRSVIPSAVIPDPPDTVLPEGWARAKVHGLLEIKYGKALKGETRNRGSVAVYGSNGVVGEHDTAITRGPTIIIGRKGTVGAVHWSASACWPIDTTYYVDEFGGHNGLFLYYAFRTLGLPELDTSSAIPGLNRDDIYEKVLPLPPFAEQKRIVAKVEELLARVNAALEGLAKVPTILKRFRQSVLTAACSGRLTEEWRGMQADLDQTAWPFCSSQPLAQSELIAEVPDSWAWFPLASLCDSARTICYGVIKLGAEFPNGVPCLRTSDVKPLYIDTSEVKRIAPKISDDYRRTLLCGREILVNVRGTLGGVAVVPEEFRGWNVSREIALVPVTKVVSEFVAFWIASLPSQNWLTGVAKGAAYTGINIADLRMLPVALPPIPEQHEIVRRVDHLFALADSIEKQVAAGTARGEKLTQAILAKAFRGELVPTEAELTRRVHGG